MSQLFYVAAAEFEAARRVSVLPEGHRSRRLHGHSFLVRIRVSLPERWAEFPGCELSNLSEALSRCVDPLNYHILNDHIDVPTNENLARWLRMSLNMPGLDSIGVQSTRHEGADLDSRDHAHVWRRFRFEAAHRLPNVPAGHKCGRMHGHGFEVVLHADQDLSGNDLGVDFDRLGSCWIPLEAQLNCACLNEIHGLENPTSEMLANWIWNNLKSELPELSWVTVYETTSAGCHYDGVNYRIWKEQSFDSALRVKRAPEGHPLQRLHGHSYVVRLHLSAALDKVMGWTVDYGDVKEAFNPACNTLDHHQLNDIAELIDTDAASVAGWIQSELQDRLPQLDRIDLYEKPGCGVLLAWGDRRPALPA